MRKPEKMIIYNLFPLLAGTFSDWPQHIERAAQMGFNWIFVNPIQLPGASGSLYAIADYFALNPLLVESPNRKSADDQVKEVIRGAEQLGLKMMVDLVINHCAADSELLDTHPEWFVWESGNRVAHPFCKEDGRKVEWKDLAQFDHKNSRDREGLFRFFLDIIRYLIDLGFKGFRCDAAYQLPGSLWERLIKETRKIAPETVFFAETLGCTPDLTRKTARAGFDYIFNSSKWWDFKANWLMKQYALTRDIAPSISFPESHDTVRLCEEFDGNVAGLKQRYLFAALFSAGVMAPIGFEFGFRKKPHVVKTRPDDWETTDIDLTSFITRVNRIKAEHPLFLTDSPAEILHHDNPQVLLMWKGATDAGQEEALLILNKDIHQRQSFHADNLQEFVQSRAPFVDWSPEDPLDYISAPFNYELQPGQGIVLLTARDAVEED